VHKLKTRTEILPFTRISYRITLDQVEINVNNSKSDMLIYSKQISILILRKTDYVANEVMYGGAT